MQGSASAPAQTQAQAPAPTTPETQPVTLPSVNLKAMGGVAIAYIVVVVMFLVLYSAGAAKLSYDRFQSGLWAIVAFIFAPIYYPFYAFMYSSAAPASMFGGRKRSKLLW